MFLSLKVAIPKIEKILVVNLHELNMIDHKQYQAIDKLRESERKQLKVEL
jgi:hypothetical protein